MNPSESEFPKETDYTHLNRQRHKMDTVFFLSQRQVSINLEDVLRLGYIHNMEEYTREFGFFCRKSLTFHINRSPLYSLYVGYDKLTAYFTYPQLEDMYLNYESPGQTETESETDNSELEED